MANYIELYRGYDPNYNNYGSPHTFIWATDDIEIGYIDYDNNSFKLFNIENKITKK